MTKQKSIQHVLKKGRYVKSRGGNSHFLDLYCGKCKEHLVLYQKDGHGSLLRLYIDRIFDPKELSELQLKVTEKSKMPNLTCSKCNSLIGIPMVYKSEKRLAFRLIRGSFLKKKNRGICSGIPESLNSRNI